MSNYYYLDYVMKSKCSPQLLPFFVPHKNARKEITESMGCFTAVKNINALIKDSIVIVAGDGIIPRTGVMFALLSKPAMVFSIDPLMDTRKSSELLDTYKIERLRYAKTCAKDFSRIEAKQRRAIVVLPHSHCGMHEAVSTVSNYSRLDIINLPCCEKVPDSFLTIDHPPGVYKDKCIHSDKNLVYIWEDYKTKTEQENEKAN